MPSYDSSLFNSNPYYDDFEEDKKFLRMLFRPGFSVQSRELTQLQTILQNQIERFGNHVFRDGSRIIGGEISTQTLDFVRLEPSSASVPVFEIAESDIVGHNITQKDGQGNVVVQARVVDYLARKSGDSYGVAVVSYLSGSQFSAGAILECSNPLKPFTATVKTAVDSVATNGKCKVVGVNDGIYYVNGFFVKTGNQFEPAYTTDSNGVRLFSNPTGTMGFFVTSEIVTDGEDFTLKDPASGSYNYNAPGAHRYRINLTLTFLTSVGNTNFIELVKYDAGVITRKNENTQYSELLKLFAQRTYDESGNYIVKPFDISFRSGGNTYHADIGSGKAYVFGYEYETKFKDSIDIPAARTFKDYADVSTANYYGSYIKAKYNVSTGDNINPLLSNILAGRSSKGHLVYGATGPVASGDFSNAAFFANVVGYANQSSIITTQGGTMDFIVHLANLSYGRSVTAANINLYHLDPSTNLSTRLFTNVELVSTAGSTNARVFDPFSVSLVHQLNAGNQTTTIKNVSKIKYIHEVSRAFVSTAQNTFPSVSLSPLGADFNWCKATGSTPSGSGFPIEEADGYYLVVISANGLLTGSILKIVSPNTTVPSDQTTVKANISADGDNIVFQTSLPIGSYYLVGKAIHNSVGMDVDGIDLTSKIRVKTLTNVPSEVFNSTLPTLNTFKRVVKTNANGVIYEMYFVLDRADVYKVNQITQGTGISATDISSRFLFDTGQRDSTYELSRLYVKPDYFDTYKATATFPQFTVNYDYFEHSGYGPFTVESYRGISYSNIPIFTSPMSGKSISLANAIDFRFAARIDGFVPSGATAGTVAGNTPTVSNNIPLISYYNGILPKDYTITSTSTAYLPRIDKLVVSKNISADGDVTTLQRIAGIPSESPIIPEDLSDSMTLFILSLPAYTFKANDIKAEYIGNSRFTMKDIGTMSKRVDGIEQYVVLNELEASVMSRSIKVGTGSDEAIKKAILVDSFEGHSVGDVVNRDYRCSVDVEKRELRPSFSSESYDFTYIGGVNGVTLTPDNILCYAFQKSATPIVSQNKASTTIKVNPFDLPNWVGSITIRPHADYWYDTEVRPMVKLNENGMNDSWIASEMNDSFGHGSQWNDWESIWNGISVELNEAEDKKNLSFFSRPRNSTNGNVVSQRFTNVEGIERSTETTSNKKNLQISPLRRKNFYTEVAANTILNKSVVPYIRGGRTISFNAYNLKPNTQVHVFFDNVNVNNHCVKEGLSGPFKTSGTDGSLIGVTFEIPNGVFEVGEKILRIVDESNNVLENATTLAETSFYAMGIKTDDFINVSSIRPAEVRKQTPNSNKVVSNPLFRDKNINTAEYTQWIDPLCQTFEVSQTFYPDGFFIESVDLFFSSKDDSLPVTIEIHPVVNGVPHPSVVLPFSTVVLNPSSVTINSVTPDVATNFKFRTPVYLEPGEYALVVKSNSSKYSLFAGAIGEFDIKTNSRISSTLPNGTLFKPQNGSERTGDSSMDIMFNINRCEFTPPTPVVPFSLGNRYSGSEDRSNADLIQPNPFIFAPSGTSISTKVTVGSVVYDVTPNRNLKLPQTFTVDGANDITMTLSPSVSRPTLLSPMVDMDRTNLITVENIVDSTAADTDELMPSSGTALSTTARYITRKLSLPSGQRADELKVMIDANIPEGSFIRLFAKTVNSQTIDASLETSNYQSMTDITSADQQVTSNVGGVQFVEKMYSLTPQNSFDTFAVKVCMYSKTNDKTIVPTLKNLRVVAVE